MRMAIMTGCAINKSSGRILPVCDNVLMTVSCMEHLFNLINVSLKTFISTANSDFGFILVYMAGESG